MARPIAGDPPAALPPSPFQTPPNGLAPPAAPTPLNYTNQPSLPAPTMPATPTPAGLWNAFRRRWVLGTFLGALVAAGVAIGAWTALPGGKHQVRAIVQLKSKGIDVVGKTQEDFNDYRSRQRFLLKARDLITRTLAEPAVASLDTVKTSDNPVQMIEDQLKVAIVAEDLLEVTMTGNNLEDMKVILDHLVQRYVADATGFERRQNDDRKKQLEQLAEQMRSEIEATDKNIDLLVRANNTTGGQDGEVRIGMLQRRSADVEGEYHRIGREIDRLTAELTILKRQLDDKDKLPIDPAVLEPLVEVDYRVVKATKVRDDAKKAYEHALGVADGNTENDVVKAAKEEWDKQGVALEDARKTAAADAGSKAKALNLAQKQSRVGDLTTLIEVRQLERDKLRVERDVLQRSIVAGAVGSNDIQRMREALKPQREALDRINVFLAQLRVNVQLDRRIEMRGEVEKVPNSNQARKIAMAGTGGIGTFFGVVLLVAFLEWRTRRVDGVDQVVNELGLRVIGTVPVFPNRANLKAAVEAGGANWRFVLNESINSARTMLLHTARTQSMQVVMVTSATQGEGKTSLASQLATSMATAGMRTLIVDCDLRNPSIQKLFELPLGPGVSEVLRQEIDVSDAIQATAVPNLWVIPAGQCSNATIAALAQGHPMETLFNRLRGQFDFIIVDSCPVLPVADALLIGQHVDGVVFSIMQDISQLPKVLTATEKMNQLSIPLIGAVVNGIKQDVYSYGYNYVKQLPAELFVVTRFSGSGGAASLLWCGRLACIAYAARDARRILGCRCDAGETPAPQQRQRRCAADPLKRVTTSEMPMPRWLVIAVAVVGLLAAAVVERLTSGVASGNVQESAARLDRVPAEFGDWTSVENPMDDKVLRVAEAAGNVSRTYTNRKNGNRVSVLLLCGPTGPIGAHEPQYCYAGSGFEMNGKPQKKAVAAPDGTAATYWSVFFEKKGSTSEMPLRVCWMWGLDGDWKASDNPRTEFALQRALYKLYVTRAEPSAAPGTRSPVGAAGPVGRPDSPAGAPDPVNEFLLAFLPEVKKALAAPTGRPN